MIYNNDIMDNSNNVKMADKLLIWKIIRKNAPPLEFKSADAFIDYLDENKLCNTKLFVTALIENMDPDVTLDELAEIIKGTGTSESLELEVSTAKQHIAYGTNRDKKKLAVKFHK